MQKPRGGGGTRSVARFGFGRPGMRQSSRVGGVAREREEKGKARARCGGDYLD